MSEESAESRERDRICDAVAQACARVPEVQLAYVFGSRVVGPTHRHSDLDVGVDFGIATPAAVRGEAKLRLIEALTDLLGPLGERSDIVDLRAANAAVAFRAIRDGRCVVSKDPRQRVRLEARIARAYDDDAPRRALFRRAALRAARRMGEGAGHG